MGEKIWLRYTGGDTLPSGLLIEDVDSCGATGMLNSHMSGLTID